MHIAVVVACIDLAVWLTLLLLRGGFWRVAADVLPEATPSPAWPEVSTPEVVAIVPARNEADMLEHTLPGLLSCKYPGTLRVVLVDDRSEDATAETACGIAARLGVSGRLTVINAAITPSGWKGKVWAMQCGLDHCAALPQAPRYVLFTDADIAYETNALTHLVAHAESKQCVLASLMVRLRCQSTAERLLIPAFVYFFRMLYPFRWVSEPHNKTAAAAGGCMLARYDALTSAGGMMPIRHALIDDCALGRLMKKQGRIWLGLTQKVRSLRAYPKFGDIRAMVARSAYDQLSYSPIKLMLALAGLVMAYIAPVWLACKAERFAQAAGIVCCLLMALSFLPMVRFYGCSVLRALTLPLVAIAYMAFTLDSAWAYGRGRGGMWKGRVQAVRAQPT